MKCFGYDTIYSWMNLESKLRIYWDVEKIAIEMKITMQGKQY